MIETYKGYVTKVKNDSFWCILSNQKYKNQHSNYDIEAEFDKEKLSEAHQAELQEGNYITWKVGYKDYKDGARNNISSLKLYLKKRTEAERKRSVKKVKELLKTINWK